MTPVSAFVLNPPAEPEDAAQALFPGRDRQESEAGYFLRIQRWREELDLPEEVFIRIESPALGKRPGLRDHLAKPQYVDFRNPCWSICSAG